MRGASSTSTACRTRRRPSGTAGACPRPRWRGSPAPPQEAGLVGLDHSREHGGQGMSLLEQVVVHEAFGRNTNGVWWYIPTVANVLSHGTPDQIDRYLRPALRGERAECYAITEADAGSDPGGVVGTARRIADGLGDRHREVVRDRRRRGRLLHRPRARQGRGRRRSRADAVPGRQGPGRRDHRRSAVHAHLPGRPSDDPLPRRRAGRHAAPRRRRRGRRAHERVVRRGARAHRRALRRRDGAAARDRHRPGRSSASSSAAASWTSRASRSRLPTPPARASR